MNTRPTKFARYPWFIEHGAELIHPDDLASFSQSLPAGNVFGYSQKEDWVILDNGHRQFRVRDKLLDPIPILRLWVGDGVLFRSKGEERQGKIHEVIWHTKENAPYFLLSCNGKPVSKRYFEADLQLLDGRPASSTGGRDKD